MPADNKALLDQHLEGPAHCGQRQSGFVDELGLGWELASRGPRASQDRVAHLGSECLELQGLAAMSFDLRHLDYSRSVNCLWAGPTGARPPPERCQRREPDLQSA